MMVEILVTLVTLGSGAVIMRAAGVTGWALVALGYVTGTALYLSLGLIQLMLPVPTTPIITVSATALTGVATWVVAKRRGATLTTHPWWTVATVGAMAAWVAVMRISNLLTWHVDSLVYLQMGAQLTWGSLEDTVTPHLLSARLIGISLIHAPASLTDDYYLRAAVPTLAIATIATIIWFFLKGSSHGLTRRQVRLAILLAVALLVTSNRVIWHALYINGHLMAGTFTLMIVGASWLLITQRAVPRSAVITMQCLGIAALIMTRPEGAVVAAIGILPLLVSDHVSMRVKSLALAAWGAGTLAWYGYSALILVNLDYRPSLIVVGQAALGALALAIAAAAARVTRIKTIRSEPWSRPFLLGVELALWAGLMLFAARDLGLLTRSANATLRNQLQSGWGVTVVGLAVLVAVTLLLVRDRSLVALRFSITTFIPLVLVLAYLRDAAYRIGPTDSLNRMWIQVIPVVVLFLMAAAAHAQRRSSELAPVASRELK